MADSKYEGEINKEQFMKVVGRLKTDLTDNVFLEMFYNIDTSLNGLISRDEFLEFSIAYGGCSDAK
jgi:Ca2+-binding EF-hand superfamily protein